MTTIIGSAGGNTGRFPGTIGAYPENDRRSRVVRRAVTQSYGQDPFATHGMPFGTVLPHVGGSIHESSGVKPHHVTEVSVVSIGAADQMQVIVPPRQADIANINLQDMLSVPQPSQPAPVAKEVERPVAQEQPKEVAVAVPERTEPKISLFQSPQLPRSDRPSHDVIPEQTAGLLQALQLLQSLVAQPQQQPQQPVYQPQQPACQPPPPPQQQPAYQTPMPAPMPVAKDSILVESLRIPGFNVIPDRPRAQVDFETPSWRMTGNYHWALTDDNKDLLLVADTRYDYPYWNPPPGNDGTVIRVTVHAADGPKTYNCLSLGMSFEFGIFKFFYLVRADK